MNEKNVNKIGWFASSMSTAMYFSYIDQIRLNLSGQTGSILLPAITTVNCITWALYGSLKTKKDWPIILCNIPGIILGIMSVITAIRW